jgi:hypothetical protein
MRIKSQKDFFSGLMFLLVGIAFAWGAGSYSIGTGARMGPGYFPMVLGVLLAGLGLVITITSLVVETAEGGSGFMLLLVGITLACVAESDSFSSGSRMVPGYLLPMVLGALLAGRGLFLVIHCLVDKPNGDPVGNIAWKPLVFIILANLVFGACIGGLPRIGLPPMGLIVGIFALTFIASNAGDEFNLKEVLILSVLLSLLSYGAFILLLKLQFPVWPTFLTR